MTAEQANKAKERKFQEAQQDSHDTHEASNRNLPVRTNDYERWRNDDMPQPGARAGYALGALSIGLGLAEILAPRQMSRLLGVRPTPFTSTAMRIFGFREIAVGVGMMLQPRNPLWAWARVAGDVVDLAALTRSARTRGNDRARIAAISAATIAVTGLDLARARQLSPRRKPRISDRTMRENKATDGIAVNRSITINRPVQDVYNFWRNLENLPRFMAHLESVTEMPDGRSVWKAKAPAGTTVSWEATLVEDQPYERISWRSTDNSQIENSGTVCFAVAPGDQGTEIHVELQYSPPAGKLGAFVAKLFGEEPNMQIATDLRRFKQVLETGEVLNSDASIHSGMHPARPSDEEPNQLMESEREILVERAADAAKQSSNEDRATTDPQKSADDRYNDELANHRSTF